MNYSELNKALIAYRDEKPNMGLLEFCATTGRDKKLSKEENEAIKLFSETLLY